MNNIIIKQFKTGILKNFATLIACTSTKEATLIDAPGATDLILEFIKENNLSLKYIINTHSHHDHIADNQLIKEKTGALILMHSLDNITYGKADIEVSEDDTVNVGEIEFKVIHTPGHTPGGICLYTKGYLFTGDSLFVGDSGRTDLPGGSRTDLGASLRKIMKLPNDTIVYPGHNYGVTQTSTLAWEKENNVNAKEYGF